VPKRYKPPISIRHSALPYVAASSGAAGVKSKQKNDKQDGFKRVCYVWESSEEDVGYTQKRKRVQVVYILLEWRPAGSSGCC